MDYSNIIIAICTAIGTSIMVVSAISRVLGKRFDKIEQRLDKIEEKLSSLESRVSKLETAINWIEKIIDRDFYKGTGSDK